MEKQPKPTTDVPVAEAKAEGQKLEWGPDLGEMSWNDTQERIKQLNTNLAEGEKLWRLPTHEELLKACEGPHDMRDFRSSFGTEKSFLAVTGFSVRKSYFGKGSEASYWSSTPGKNDSEVVNVDMSYKGQTVIGYKKSTLGGYYARLVRDVA